MRQVKKVSDTQLEITDETIEYIKKERLEGKKRMLESRLLEVNNLLAVFTGGAASTSEKRNI